jgi:hypothetical protein
VGDSSCRDADSAPCVALDRNHTRHAGGRTDEHPTAAYSSANRLGAGRAGANAALSAGPPVMWREERGVQDLCRRMRGGSHLQLSKLLHYRER